VNLTAIAKALTAAGIRRPAVVLRGTLHATWMRQGRRFGRIVFY